MWKCVLCIFFFQAEDGIRDAQESRGIGDVYKRQVAGENDVSGPCRRACHGRRGGPTPWAASHSIILQQPLIHI